MNYEQEVENMKNAGGDVFKPKPGQYSVLIMKEPEKTIFKQENGDETPQIKCEVRVDNKENSEQWYITKGLTSKSLYGQLMIIGKEKGKLEGETITLLVKSSKGKNGEPRNDYTVVEAIKLMKEPEIETEKV